METSFENNASGKKLESNSNISQSSKQNMEKKQPLRIERRMSNCDVEDLSLNRSRSDSEDEEVQDDNEN